MSDFKTDEHEKHDANQYHHIVCDEFAELKISLSERGRKRQVMYSLLGISSTATIGQAMKAVDASPFKTVFVVSEKTGKVLFALSKNEDYTIAARKKKPVPDPKPPKPPVSYCCRKCQQMGGTSCVDYPDGPCICFGAGSSTPGGSLTDALETLAP